MSAHACVEHQEPLICFVELAFNFAPRDAGFDPHTNRGKLVHFDPAPERDGMQSQFLSSLSHPKILSITCSHDRQSITERYFHCNCYLPWADGPIVELVYEVHGVVPKGTGQIVIREFKPDEDVLQLVQDNAAHPMQTDQYGQPQAIYVDGQWKPHGKAFLWTAGGRCELIYQQNGVIFWIAGDQRDGLGERDLWKIAQSLHPINFSHYLMLMRGEAASVTQTSMGDAHDPFATDVLVIYPDGSPNEAYLITVSSYQSDKPVHKTAAHTH
jgi:hypothetical protein